MVTKHVVRFEVINFACYFMLVHSSPGWALGISCGVKIYLWAWYSTQSFASTWSPSANLMWFVHIALINHQINNYNVNHFTAGNTTKGWERNKWKILLDFEFLWSKIKLNFEALIQIRFDFDDGKRRFCEIHDISWYYFIVKKVMKMLKRLTPCWNFHLRKLEFKRHL